MENKTPVKWICVCMEASKRQKKERDYVHHYQI